MECSPDKQILLASGYRGRQLGGRGNCLLRHPFHGVESCQSVFRAVMSRAGSRGRTVNRRVYTKTAAKASRIGQYPEVAAVLPESFAEIADMLAYTGGMLEELSQRISTNSARKWAGATQPSAVIVR